MRHVLVIDDDPDIRRLLLEVLETEGYHVASARDGDEALRYLAGRRGRVLLLLDLMMPGMDGYTMLRALAHDPATRERCRIVVMSASERLRAGGFEGADAALPKPFDLLDLLDIVEVLARDDAPGSGAHDESTLPSYD